MDTIPVSGAQKADDQGAKQSPGRAAQAVKPKSNLWIITIAAVAVVAVVAVLLLSGVLQIGGAMLGAISPATSGHLDALLAPQSNRTFAKALGIIARGVNSTQELNVTYAGVATMAVGSGLGNVRFTMPLAVKYQKYQKDSRVSLDVSDVPLLSNFSLVYIRLANSTSYMCATSPKEIPMGENNTIGLHATLSFTCQKEAASSSNAPLNASQLSTLAALMNGVPVRVRSAVSHSGQSCVPVSLNGTINPQSLSKESNSLGSIPLASSLLSQNATYNYTISMCLSEQYYLPLNVTAQLNMSSSSQQGMSMLLSLNATSVSGSANDNAVTSLPGPVTTSQSTISGSQQEQVQAPPPTAQQKPAGTVALFNSSRYEGIEVPNESALIAGGNVTISGWFMPIDALSQNEMFYFGFRNDFDADFYAAEFLDEADMMEMRFTDHMGYPTSLYQPINYTGWNQVALVANYTNLTAYVNGVKTYSMPITPSGFITNVSLPLYIGIYDNHASMFNGYMSNVQLYDYALNPSDIAAIYAQGINGQVPGYLRARLVGWWPLNGTVNDYSANHNNGKKNNGNPLPSFTGGAP